MENTKKKIKRYKNLKRDQTDIMERFFTQNVNKRKKEEQQNLSYVDDMCVESLDPETFKKWESIKSILTKNRNLK